MSMQMLEEHTILLRTPSMCNVMLLVISVNISCH